MEIEHYPVQIGTRDAEGYRTFGTPGDVCSACSDPEAGRWVPVSQCPTALARLDELDDWLHGSASEPQWHRDLYPVDPELLAQFRTQP